MSTTNTETGWTKPLPQSDGDYFSRIDEYDKSSTLIRIENHAIYEMGQAGSLAREYAAEDYEYLGPFTAADFEQLTRLREALQEIADKDTLCNCEHDTEYCCVKVGHYCAFCIAATALTQRAAGGES